MAISTKLKAVGNPINSAILDKWKDTVSRHETIRKRLEEALLADIESHKKSKE